MLSAVLDATLLHQTSRVEAATLKRWDEAMDVISDAAQDAYTKLIEHEGLPDFFTQATPVDELSMLNVGSRPGKRPGAGGQTSLDGPARDPVGVRLDPDPHDRARLVRAGQRAQGRARRRLLRGHRRDAGLGVLRQPHLQRRDDAGEDRHAHRRVLRLRARRPRAAGGLRDHQGRSTGSTEREVLKLTPGDELLGGNPLLRRTLDIREGYLEPLHHLQVHALAERRKVDEPDPDLQRALLLTVNGISAGMRNTG